MFFTQHFIRSLDELVCISNISENNFLSKIVDALSYVLCYILFLLSIHNNFKFEDISSTHCFYKVKTNSVLILGSLDRIFLFFKFIILLYCLVTTLVWLERNSYKLFSDGEFLYQR